MKVNPTTIIRNTPNPELCYFEDIPAGEWFRCVGSDENLYYKADDFHAVHFQGIDYPDKNSVLVIIDQDQQIVQEDVEIHVL